ncbi:MAG: isoprenylcysteine carboxylmethyltransferase family protein [Candidatus Hydrogenedentes bacterium]|nr:isoprenylcysteine carboxylmethyltransferase family protein [Candidatus Hydrogenedentota bacterium]
MVYIKTALFALLVPGTVAGLIPYWIASSFARKVPAWYVPWSSVGWIPILLGLIVLTWCAMDFARKGQGTPAPIDPPKYLVVRGLYHYVRNPMYVGVLSILLGEWLVAPSIPLLLYAIVVGSMFHEFVVLYEEPALRKKFGTAYEDYCRQVNRWLPRLRHLRKSM